MNPDLRHDQGLGLGQARSLSLGLNLNPDWIIPQWPAPAQVRAVCTTRAGGVSMAPYDSFNLGDHVGDDARHVAHNRALLRDAIHAAPVFMTQVHGVKVEEHAVPAPSATVLHADACITRCPGVACTIMVADCLPVLFTNRQGTRVGAAHAGWRGLAGEASVASEASGIRSGVLEEIYKSFKPLASVSIALSDMNNVAKSTLVPDSRPDVLVWLGPCIGPDKFEVGGDVRDAFLVRDASAGALFKPCGPGKWLADLAGLARLRLHAMGIETIYGNDGSPAWCTVSNPSRFFSHRRDAVALGGSGRMAACIWLAE